MTIRKNIAFSLLFHSLLFFLTVLSARYIVSGERIFFVELKDNPGAEQQLTKWDDKKRVDAIRTGRITQKDEPVVPAKDQKQDQGSEIKSTPEDQQHEPAISRPVHEKAEEAPGSLQEKPGKAGYGAGLRIMVDKRSRTNLAVDFGFGQKSFGFYLAASETF